MAISAPHYRILRGIQPLVNRGGSLLEIGEANWYGEAMHDFHCDDATNLFAVAKSFYADWMAPEKIVSIDANGTKEALRFDLNQPISLDREFDVVINHGTAEHVFDIAQVFRTIHDRCAVGGLMIHDSPFHGWIDHGFYCLQPTLFYDLARANNYEVARMYLYDIKSNSYTRLDSRDHIVKLANELPKNTAIIAVLKKLFDIPFRIPTQGYYAGTLSESGRNAWEENR